jgi:hypothetical protein
VTPKAHAGPTEIVTPKAHAGPTEIVRQTLTRVVGHVLDAMINRTPLSDQDGMLLDRIEKARIRIAQRAICRVVLNYPRS